MPDRLVVCNTSPLLYLHQVGHLELLRDLYDQIQVPPAVRAELRAGLEGGAPAPDIDEISWIHVQDLRDTSLLPAVIDLGAGEAEAIALALAAPGSLLILDDALGRRIAQVSGVTYTGTLGVLIRAKKEGFLPRVAPVLEALEETTMYLSRELIAMILRESGEKG